QAAERPARWRAGWIALRRHDKPGAERQGARSHRLRRQWRVDVATIARGPTERQAGAASASDAHAESRPQELAELLLPGRGRGGAHGMDEGPPADELREARRHAR